MGIFSHEQIGFPENFEHAHDGDDGAEEQGRQDLRQGNVQNLGKNAGSVATGRLILGAVDTSQGGQQNHRAITAVFPQIQADENPESVRRLLQIQCFAPRPLIEHAASVQKNLTEEDDDSGRNHHRGDQAALHPFDFPAGIQKQVMEPYRKEKRNPDQKKNADGRKSERIAQRQPERAGIPKIPVVGKPRKAPAFGGHGVIDA